MCQLPANPNLTVTPAKGNGPFGSFLTGDVIEFNSGCQRYARNATCMSDGKWSPCLPETESCGVLQSCPTKLDFDY